MPFITKEIDTLRVKNAMNILNIDEKTTRAILRFAKQANIADIKLAQKYYDYANEYINNHALIHFPDMDATREALAFILSQNAFTTSTRLVAPHLRLNVEQLGFRQYAHQYLNSINATWDNTQDVETSLHLWFDNFLQEESIAMWDQYYKTLDKKRQQLVDDIDTEINNSNIKLSYSAISPRTHQSIVQPIQQQNDYDAIQNAFVITQLLHGDTNQNGPLFNWSIFTTDPLLHDLRKTNVILPQNASNTDMEKAYTRVLDSLKKCKNLFSLNDVSISGSIPKELEENIKNALITRVISDEDRSEAGKRKLTLRKRWLRLIQHFTKGPQMLDPNEDIAYAKLGMLIAENDSSRCIDGIDQWLTKTESMSLRNIHDNDTSEVMSFAKSVTLILTQQKIAHIQSHIPDTSKLSPFAVHNRHDKIISYNTYNFAEVATNGPLLLTQRLRLGFGIPISHAGLSAGPGYPDMKTVYDPFEVALCFFQGGQISFQQRRGDFIDNGPFIGPKYTVQFSAFTPEVFIQDIHQA